MEDLNRYLNVRYRMALLPHIKDLRTQGGIDLNLIEEILGPLGLTDLNRAARIAQAIQ